MELVFKLILIWLILIRFLAPYKKLEQKQPKKEDQLGTLQILMNNFYENCENIIPNMFKSNKKGKLILFIV